MAPSPQAVQSPGPARPSRVKFIDSIARRLSRVTSGEHLIPEVDGLRFAALLLVILHHAVASYLTSEQPLGPINLPMEWLKAGNQSRFFYLVSHVGFAIPMFFVLSGFILSLPFLRAVIDGTPRPGFKRFFLRRLTRMEPPYAVALLLNFALLVWQGKPVLLFARHLAASSVYLHAAIYGGASWILGVAWTLEIDAQFYLALPILQRLLFRKSRATRRILTAGVILAGGIASQLYLDTPQAPRILNLGLPNWIQFFAAGFLLADLYLDYWRNLPARHPRLWDAAGVMFFALILADVLQRPHAHIPWRLQSSWNGGLGAFLLPWLIVGAFAAVFRGAALKWLATRRWVVIGGGMSYTIYLYHLTLIILLTRPVCRLIGSGLRPVPTSLLVFLILLIPIFAVSAILFVLTEKPFMGWRPPNLSFGPPQAWLYRIRAMTQREALLVTALLVALVKSIEFAFDSQALFSFDSGSFFLNAMGMGFIPERSYVYSALIRIFAVPFHSLRMIVAMQTAMGGITAWLLAFSLMRFLRVRPWIAVLAALAFALDPVQILYEHMVMTETSTLLAMAAFLAAALEYLRRRSPYWLAILSCLGVCLVSLRIVYLPCVLVTAVLVPVGAWLWQSNRRARILALALVVSCGSTFLLHIGYRHLTGWLGHREPAYHYSTGFFMLAGISPIAEPADSRDPRIAHAVAVQSTSALPLLASFRSGQLWYPEGLVAKIKAVFPGDRRAADQAAGQLALAAIQRHPASYLRLAIGTYLSYWEQIPALRFILPFDNGSQPPGSVTPVDARLISSAFAADVSNQDQLNTFTRRYHIFGHDWYLFLLAAPFLTGVVLLLKPKNPQGLALLLVWNLLMLAAICFGAVEAAYRFLHPFSFTALAACAVLYETLLVRHFGSSPEHRDTAC